MSEIVKFFVHWFVWNIVGLVGGDRRGVLEFDYHIVTFFFYHVTTMNVHFIVDQTGTFCREKKTVFKKTKLYKFLNICCLVPG